MARSKGKSAEHKFIPITNTIISLSKARKILGRKSETFGDTELIVLLNFLDVMSDYLLGKVPK